MFPRQARLYRKYRAFTMMDKLVFIENLTLCQPALALDGDVVECGTWRGGMSAAMAEVWRAKAAARRSVLFDSFQGLPPPDAVDGETAFAWASDTASPLYYDIVIIDDYGVWDGCTRAVHDYLSKTQRAEPIRRTRIASVVYLTKQAD